MKPLRNKENPSLHEIVEVSQMGSDPGFWFAVVMATICTFPAGYILLHLNMESWFYLPLFLLLSLLTMASLVAGLCLGFWLVSKWEKQLFVKTTAVTGDEQGMTVDGLGKSPWADILSIEGIPDSYSTFIVHTRQFGRVALSMDVATAVPVFDFYLSRPQHLDGVMGNFSIPTSVFKLYIFNWWRFRLWIALGYLAGASAVALLLSSANSDGFKLFVAIVCLAPLVAFLVWFFPLTHLSVFRARHVLAFTVRAARLQSTDGRWDIDLNKADIKCHHAHGLGYDFQVVSISSPESKRLDVGLPVEELTPFLDALASRHTPF